MRAIPTFFFTLITPCILLFSCKEQKEELQIETAAQYIPLQTGKYITYRLDSTVFVAQGRTEETHSYQEKHVVDVKLKDNLGRPSYRVFRYLRDLAGTQAWRPNGTYFITPEEYTVEVIEDNLRSVKLVSPIRQGKTWKGNRFMGFEPYASLYNFSNDDNMAEWDFTVEDTDATIQLNGKTINDVVTTNSIDESLNVPITDAKAFASRTLMVEKYAKNLGLVFQEIILWEYQPNPGGSPYKIGFGVKRSLIDYN